MRISDWSSDVGSSDLRSEHACLPARSIPWAPRGATGDGKSSSLRSRPHPPFGHLLPQTGEGLQPILPRHAIALLLRSGRRSEEHTSELQSLMRISYAVFCLKKKIQHQHNYHAYSITT